MILTFQMLLNILLCSTRMSSETLLKTTEPILEKPEGGGDVLNCQENNAGLLLVPFQEENMRVAETWLQGASITS